MYISYIHVNLLLKFYCHLLSLLGTKKSFFFQFTLEKDKDIPISYTIINIMSVDGLVMTGDKALAVMVFTYCAIWSTLKHYRFLRFFSQRRPEQPYCTQSILWLLMGWQFQEPGHQPSWYWPTLPYGVCAPIVSGVIIRHTAEWVYITDSEE